MEKNRIHELLGIEPGKPFEFPIHCLNMPKVMVSITLAYDPALIFKTTYPDIALDSALTQYILCHPEKVRVDGRLPNPAAEPRTMRGVLGVAKDTPFKVQFCEDTFILREGDMGTWLYLYQPDQKERVLPDARTVLYIASFPERISFLSSEANTKKTSTSSSAPAENSKKLPCRICELLGIEVGVPFSFAHPTCFKAGVDRYEQAYRVSTYTLVKNRMDEFYFKDESNYPIDATEANFILRHPQLVLHLDGGESLSGLLGIKEGVLFTVGSWGQPRYVIRRGELFLESGASACQATLAYLVNHPEMVIPVAADYLESELDLFRHLAKDWGVKTVTRVGRTELCFNQGLYGNWTLNFDHDIVDILLPHVEPGETVTLSETGEPQQ